MLLPLLATLYTGLFTGAALYVSLVAQPARLEAGAAVALAEFRPSFPRARRMQASLALIGALAAAGAWFGGWSAIFLLVALLLAGNVAFTFIAIVPVYERLLDPALAPEAPEALPLLRHWGRLHALRSAVGLIAFLLALFGLALGGLLRMAL